MDLERLQSLFPKYDIRWRDDMSYSIKILGDTYIIPKNDFKKLDQIIDIYNSIEYVIEFLLLNEFETIHSRSFANFKLNIFVYICLDSYFAEGKRYDAKGIITYLRKKFDSESYNKLISQ